MKTLRAIAVLVAVALDLMVPAAHASNIVYAYDALGRLIQASNLDAGQAVLYGYDGLGNISSQ